MGDHFVIIAPPPPAVITLFPLNEYTPNLPKLPVGFTFV